MKAPVLLRGALLAVLAGAAALLMYTYDLGRWAVTAAPQLAALQMPLYAAALLGAMLTAAVGALAWAWSSLLARGQRSSGRAVTVLARLRVGVGVLGIYVAVCTVGMSSILDGMYLGMPGVWLAALIAEGVLVAVSFALARQHSSTRTELAYSRRHPSTAPSPETPREPHPCS